MRWIRKADPGEAPEDPAPAPKSPRKEKRPPRPLLLRLFGVGVFGAIRLLLLCVLVGFVMLVMRFDPGDPDFGARQAATALWRNAREAAVWAARNFWQPALAGATVVLPVWVLWRLLTLPLRR